MESETPTNNEELTSTTSTMGNMMSTNDEAEKSDVCDSTSTPTSTSGAFTTTSISSIVAEDPISSTSSELKKSKPMESPRPEPMPEAEFPAIEQDLGLVIAPIEKITENVEDIVQDLENLLGAPTDFVTETKTEPADDAGLNLDIEQSIVELEGTNLAILAAQKSPNDIINETQLKHGIEAELPLEDKKENIFDENVATPDESAEIKSEVEPEVELKQEIQLESSPAIKEEIFEGNVVENANLEAETDLIGGKGETKENLAEIAEITIENEDFKEIEPKSDEIIAEEAFINESSIKESAEKNTENLIFIEAAAEESLNNDEIVEKPLIPEKIFKEPELEAEIVKMEETALQEPDLGEISMEIEENVTIAPIPPLIHVPEPETELNSSTVTILSEKDMSLELPVEEGKIPIDEKVETVPENNDLIDSSSQNELDAALSSITPMQTDDDPENEPETPEKTEIIEASSQEILNAISSIEERQEIEPEAPETPSTTEKLYMESSNQVLGSVEQDLETSEAVSSINTASKEENSEAALSFAETEAKLKEPLVINVGEVEKERPYSPKITIKPIKPPEEALPEKAPLKMTITKQSNTLHSILKIFNPDEESPEMAEEEKVPKLIIKTNISEQLSSPKHSPKTSRSSKVFSPSSPRITIKPLKPPDNLDHSLKITIKTGETQKHSPKLTIKPIIKPVEEESEAKSLNHSPRITIKPIVPPIEEGEQQASPRITIKPIVKPVEAGNEPKTPKITIKPLIKPDVEEHGIDEGTSYKERIVLKINKGNIHKEESPLAKIKLKFSKEGGHARIVQEDASKSQEFAPQCAADPEDLHPQSPVSYSKLKEMLCASAFPNPEKPSKDDDDDEEVSIIESTPPKGDSPITISEESNQESLPPVPITPILVPAVIPIVIETPPIPVTPTPRKRGRPRKVPLEVREDFKEEEKPIVIVESTRPKRSCRGSQSVRATLGIKTRKPRGPGRGRGGKRGMGNRALSSPSRPAKEPKLSAKIRQQQEKLLAALSAFEPEGGFYRALAQESSSDRADIVMYEEETRMSAETNSRAQTPAKQVQIATVDLVDESQSSIQSTTESAKAARKARLEVQEPEGAVISADQLAEYYWSGGGPYMLQEQVAQFLGIKSFKRKYPNIPRRVVDMQERDFIRESGLAGESMCDLGLTAVTSADILDIMYSDFQDKYEEYCKHQRDRQAKDLTNKQKALSLAASHEKNKLDITQQAVQSAASWNASFNKARKEERKASMDLQTLTVHFPKGRMKAVAKAKVGFYPVALVPGQFTDYYGDFTPSELSDLPLNTQSYGNVVKNTVREMECDSQTDGSGSDSESSSSGSDSSFSGSSDDDCTLCKPTSKKLAV